MKGRKANASIYVTPVTYEYGQVFETTAYPYGLIVTLSNGGLQLGITKKHSPEAIQHYTMAKDFAMKKRSIKRLGMDVPKSFLDYHFTDLGINPSAPVEVNGNQVGIGELVESYYTQAIALRAQQKLLPGVRRLAPGVLVASVGFAAAISMTYLTIYAPSVLVSGAAGMFYDAIEQIIPPSQMIKLSVIVNSGLEIISAIGGASLGTIISKKRDRKLKRLEELTVDLSETLRLALLEDGKVAGTLPVNYGVIRHRRGGGYVPAVRK